MDDLINPPITGLTLNATSIEIRALGGTALLETATTPANQNYVITYVSDDPDVATVDSTGKITATGRGVATITASSGNLSATCVVICNFYVDNTDDPPATDPVYEESDLTFKDFGYGYEATFPLSWYGGSYSLYNGNIPAELVAFSSNSEEVATVDETGCVTFVGTGRALITARYGEWEITFRLYVTES
jgi:uncharacterized protein YjdB